ncbi:6813_t:CDS:2, partial [Entrophospora sp. SA101]
HKGKQRLVINIKDIMEFNPQTGTIKGNWVEAINRLANLTDSRLEKNKIKNMLEYDSITAFFPYTSGGEKTAGSALETRYDNDILLCDGY